MKSITDFCEPCPSNGQCYEGKLECDRGYRKHGKLCIEDGEINKTAKKLVGPQNLIRTFMYWDRKMQLLPLKKILFVLFLIECCVQCTAVGVGRISSL